MRGANTGSKVKGARGGFLCETPHLGWKVAHLRRARNTASHHDPTRSMERKALIDSGGVNIVARLRRAEWDANTDNREWRR